AAQPEGRLHVGSDYETGRRLASGSAHPSSLARSALRRQTPKVGAGCPNWARPDPCGGCPAMGIPTAILGRLQSILDRAKTGSSGGYTGPPPRPTGVAGLRRFGPSPFPPRAVG